MAEVDKRRRDERVEDCHACKQEDFVNVLEEEEDGECNHIFNACHRHKTKKDTNGKTERNLMRRLVLLDDVVKELGYLFLNTLDFIFYFIFCPMVHGKLFYRVWLLLWYVDALW